MIDTLTIILSTTICLFILFRAVRLDRQLPWYPQPGGEAGASNQKWSPAWDTGQSPPDGATGGLPEQAPQGPVV